jgi:hypothetical protein
LFISTALALVIVFKMKSNYKSLLITAAATLVYIEFYTGNVKRGFWCGDKSISLQRKEKDTISIKSVILFGLLPILFVSTLIHFYQINNVIKFNRCGCANLCFWKMTNLKQVDFERD